MKLYSKVVKFVDTSFGIKKVHFGRTVYWYEKFLPKITEAHKIAAYSHDIERVFCDKKLLIPENYLDHTYLRNHQRGGAKIISKFLEAEGASKDLIKKVAYLVSQHEVGGDNEQDALMDADSVSFFETQAEMFVTRKALNEGKGKIKEKLDWMFDRIKSKEAKMAATANYTKWVKLLK